MRLILDTGVLGQVVHPRKHGDVRLWLAKAATDHDILVSEVCDYELRRELLRIGATRSLTRLDELGRELRYLPVTTTTWRSAARLWAMTRRAGRPGADSAGLDGDVLLAAQARVEGATIVTTNPRHFVAGDFFGFSVALSADGSRALVGAYSDDTEAGGGRQLRRLGRALGGREPRARIAFHASPLGGSDGLVDGPWWCCAT